MTKRCDISRITRTKTPVFFCDLEKCTKASARASYSHFFVTTREWLTWRPPAVIGRVRHTYTQIRFVRASPRLRAATCPSDHEARFREPAGLVRRHSRELVHVGARDDDARQRRADAALEVTLVVVGVGRNGRTRQVR